MEKDGQIIWRVTNMAEQVSAKARLRLMYSVGESGLLIHLTQNNILAFIMVATVHRKTQRRGTTMYVTLCMFDH